MQSPSASADTMPVDDRFDVFASQNEEWIVRLEALGRGAEEGVNDKDNDNEDEDECLAVKRAILHTTRLANLQCASAAYREREQEREIDSASETRIATIQNTNVDRLILEAQHEIDTDWRHHESMLKNILGGTSLGAAHPKSPSKLSSPPQSQSILREDDLCTSLDVDAFFDAYPECGRSIHDGAGDYSDNDSDSGSDNDNDEEYNTVSRHSKRRTSPSSSNEVASMTIDLVEAASKPFQTQMEEQSQSQSHFESQPESQPQFQSQPQSQFQSQSQSRALEGYPREDPSGQQHSQMMKPLSNNSNHANTTASASISVSAQNPYANRKPNRSQSSFSVPRSHDNSVPIDLSGSTTNTSNNSSNNNHNNNNDNNRRLQSSAMIAHGTSSNANTAMGGDRNHNSNTQNRPIDPIRNPYRRSSTATSQNRSQQISQPVNHRGVDYDHQDSNSNSNDAWMDHRNQTNPFQTAREVAIAEQNHPQRDPFRNRGGDDRGYSRSQRQNQNPRQQHQQRHQQQQQQQHPQNQPQNSYNNPYGCDFQGNQDRGVSNPFDNVHDGNGNDTGASSSSAGGPFIPDSLKRKYQLPKRGLGSQSRAQVGNSNAIHRPSAPKANSNTNISNNSRNNYSNNNGGNNNNNNANSNRGNHRPSNSNAGGQTDKRNTNEGEKEEDELPEELQHLDKELVKKIQNEIMESGDTVTFDDIAGLDDAKATVQEVVCWPMKRPDLFTGLRRAPNGLLLYGPPGTGKTLIGKAIAHESGATFFSISSSSLTSKWIGEGEKLVKTLFAVAAYNEPAVIFLDEIDSLLTQRKSSENEASRRIKTEFLVQLDGTGTTGQGRVLIIGATNRPQELDEAARRRFTKRLYIPLPVEADRKVLLEVLLKTNNHVLTAIDIATLAKDTKGFSGADLKSLCTDAAMGPIRQLGARAMEIKIDDVPPISYKHFQRSLKGTRPSVAPGDLTQYLEWDKTYGTKRYDEDEDD